MTTRKIRFLQGTLVEGIGTPITMLLGIIVVPYYFRFIDSNQYGYWIALFELVGFFGLFYAGTDLYIIQTIAKEKTAGLKSTQTHLSSVFFAQFLILIGLVFLCYLLYFFLPFFNLSPNKYIEGKTVYILLSIWLIINISGNMILSIIVGQNKVGLSGLILFCSKTLLQITPLCLLFLGFKLEAFGYSYALVASLIVLITLGYEYKYIKTRLSLKFIRVKELKSAFVFIFNCLFGRAGFYIFNYTDAIIIAKLLTTSAVTTYVLTMKLGNVFRFLTAKIVNIGFPSYIQLIAEKEYERLQEVVLVFFRISIRSGLYFAFIIFFLNDVFVIHWVGKDRYGGMILSILSGVICFRESIIPIFTNIIFSTEDVKTINIIIFLEALLNLILSIWFATIWGITGVAFATVISTCLFSFSYLIFKGTHIIQLKPRLLLESSIKVIFKSIPSIVAIIVGSIYLSEGFSWIYFAVTLILSGILNVACFEGRSVFQYKNLPFKEIIKKTIENS